MADSLRFREQVARVACNGCRVRKLRCDTQRPTCTTCTKTSRQCEYDTRYVYETRSDALRRENKELQQQINELKALRQNDLGTIRPEVDIGVRDDDHEKGSRATSTTVGRSNMEFDRTSVDSSAHATRSNAGSFSDVYSDVSGTWQDDAAAQVPTSKSGRQLSQLAQVEQGHAILVRPDEQKASVDVHESVATRILEALIRSDDERSAFLLANLRVGLSWREMAAHLAQSDEGRHYDLSQTMRTNLKRQDPGSSHDVEYRNRARSTHLASTVTNISNGSDTSLMSWLKSSFDLSYWMRDRHDRQGQKVAASVGKAEYITFAKSWNRHFGNLDLANAIEANNYSRAQQDLQKGNLSAPIWAMRLMNYHDMSDPFSQAIANIYQECEAAGDIEVFCGPHAYIEAVADEAAYNIAPKLSQHLARLIKGIRPDDPRPSGLHYALLTAFWALLNWSLRPSKTSYDEIPAYLRPSPWQYFVVHSHIVDFTTSLLQREYLCRTSDADMSWVVEGSRTVECDFPQNIPWFERDSKSGHIVLSAECKAHALRLESFTMGPSLRAVLPNADSFYRIRI